MGCIVAGDRSAAPSFGWDATRGAYGTYFRHDPHERMDVIFMMQSQAARLPYRCLMRDLVYRALTGNYVPAIRSLPRKSRLPSGTPFWRRMSYAVVAWK